MMIELRGNTLTFQFPGVHEEASCSIDFQRTLRIPDDNKAYPLPPGLGKFPVEHVDDYASKVPLEWATRGGVLIPMYQSEALWINFDGPYPCAIKIAAGKTNAVDGSSWSPELSKAGQDYVVVPEQPWVDGFNVTEDHIRQFVAMPLGEGYTAEEQITGKSEHGGLQVIVYPMKSEHYEKLFKQLPNHEELSYCMYDESLSFSMDESMSMGLGPGGLMHQKIYADPYGADVWDQDKGLKCFIHLVNSQVYAELTGSAPPHKPPAARDYSTAGLPWFEHYSDSSSVTGSKVLSGLTSIGAKTIEETGTVLSDNDSVEPEVVKWILATNVIRQGEF